MLVEAANSSGQAAGPILMGTVGLLASLDWSVLDPGDVGSKTFHEGVNPMSLEFERAHDTMRGDLFGRSIRAPFGQLNRLVEGGGSMLLAGIPKLFFSRRRMERDDDGNTGRDCPVPDPHTQRDQNTACAGN